MAQALLPAARSLFRIRRHIAIQKLPVSWVAVHVVSSIAPGIENRASFSPPLTCPIDGPQNLSPICSFEKRLHLFQSVSRGILLHRKKSLKLASLIRNSALPLCGTGSQHQRKAYHYGRQYSHSYRPLLFYSQPSSCHCNARKRTKEFS